jgi:HAE1 family hydrophobic/amphiphilic exporter-1
MVGGLIVSQALTLFTTPVIYLYLDQVSHWISGSKRAKAPKEEREPEPEERPWEPAQAAE